MVDHPPPWFPLRNSIQTPRQATLGLTKRKGWMGEIPTVVHTCEHQESSSQIQSIFLRLHLNPSPPQATHPSDDINSRSLEGLLWRTSKCTKEHWKLQNLSQKVSSYWSNWDGQERHHEWKLRKDCSVGPLCSFLLDLPFPLSVKIFLCSVFSLCSHFSTVLPFTGLFLQETFLKSLLLVLQSANREPSIHPSLQRTWSVLLYSLI